MSLRNWYSVLEARSLSGSSLRAAVITRVQQTAIQATRQDAAVFPVLCLEQGKFLKNCWSLFQDELLETLVLLTAQELAAEAKMEQNNSLAKGEAT